MGRDRHGRRRARASSAARVPPPRARPGSASTRPWRARESTLGHAAARPLAAARRARGPAGRDPRGADLVPVVGAPRRRPRRVARLRSSWCGCWSRRRSPWPVIAAVGGVVVLRCIVTLFALSFTGPGGYWFAFWTEPTRAHRLHRGRVRPVRLAVRRRGLGARRRRSARRRATGIVLAGVGCGLAIPAVVVAVVGLETALTVWNDEMGLLPWGLARILGITVYLDIPDDDGVVRRRVRARDRRGRRAARAAVRASRSTSRARGRGIRGSDELAGRPVVGPPRDGSDPSEPDEPRCAALRPTTGTPRDRVGVRA